MKKSLFYFTLIWILTLGHSVSAQCDADTSIFYLSQNEFSSGVVWYYTNEAYPWSGGYDLYSMYDPCVAQSNTLIISEVNQGAGNQGAYIELTNVGSDSVDLSEYRIATQRNNYPTPKIQRMTTFILNGMLAPGECYVIMAASYYDNLSKSVMSRGDSIARHNVKLEAIADFKAPSDKGVNAYPNVIGRTVDLFDDNWRNNLVLLKLTSDTVEVAVDVFNTSYAENGNATIAGVPNAPSDYTIVRKQFIGGRTYGNTDFRISAGSEAAEASEWIVLPRFRSATSHLPTTIGSHNVTSVYGVSAKDGLGAVVDQANSIIYLPSTAYKGDSIISYLNVNADMTWEYKLNGVLEEELSNLIHTGDSVTFYHCGVEVTSKSYHIEALPFTGTTAMAVSLKRKSNLNTYYNLTMGLEVDTIYGSSIYYDYPVDTFIKYIEIPDSATVEMIWANGNLPRPYLKEGDKLRVVSKDKAVTHDYYIACVPYEENILSHDASLSFIRWPEYPVEELDPYVWSTGDSIPGFNSEALSYIVKLPLGTEEIPALLVLTNSARAFCTSQPATDLYGSEEAQTSTFTVLAEDGTTSLTYAVRFIVETKEVVYEGEPFISEISMNTGASVSIEICNPGNTLLDLSDYVLAAGRGNKKTLSSLLAWNASDFFRNVHIYRPGYVYDSLTMVSNAEYWFDPNGDANVDAWVEPGGTFTIATTKVSGGDPWGYVNKETSKWESWAENGIIEGPNVVLHGASSSLGWEYNKYGGNVYELIGRSSGNSYEENTFFLLRIKNDSIKDGTKGAGSPDDYEFVDVVGKIEDGKTCGWLLPATGQRFYPIWGNNVLMRNPDIYKGNPVSLGSFGYAGIETPDDYDGDNKVKGDSTAFEWTYQTDLTLANYDMGRHSLLPVTVYKSTIQSEQYEVTLGLSMDEEIFGVPENTTVEDFLSNIIKLNADQTLEMKTASGDLLLDFDILQEGSILMVTSADKENTSQYTIHTGVLSTDVSLSSSVYDVVESVVKLSAITTTVTEMKENLTVNPMSKMYFLAGNGAILPTTTYDLRDSAYYQTPITSEVSIKVVAQSGAEKTYKIELAAQGSSAYVTSSTFKIDQENKLINGVRDGINVEMLLKSLVVSEGATMVLVNKWEQEKDFGIVFINDVIKVVSADGSNTVYYGVTLTTESEPEVILNTPLNEMNYGAGVYPNPTTGVLYFDKVFVNVKVYDIAGKLVKEAEQGAQLDLSSFDNGVYILTVLDINHKQSTVKVVKQ